MAGAGVSSAILTAFDLRTKANRTRDAWRVLRVELLRFAYCEPDAENRERLLLKYDQAEHIIGDVAPEGLATESINHERK
jgi:hypothetical protein